MKLQNDKVLLMLLGYIGHVNPEPDIDALARKWKVPKMTLYRAYRKVKQKRNKSVIDLSSKTLNLKQECNEFDIGALYSLYPRKIGKTRGIAKLKREIKSEQDYYLCVRAIENYAKSVRGKEMEYVKHFSSFVSEWRDWITHVEQKSASSINTEPVPL